MDAVLMALVVMASDQTPSIKTANLDSGTANTTLKLDLGAVEDAPVPVFGVKDSWRWNLWAGYSDNMDDAHQGHLGGGVSWFPIDNLSLDFDLFVLGINQPDDDAVAGNLNIMFRWHFLAEQTWSLYAEIGAGLFLASDDVPSAGSSFNFTPQLGGGASFQVMPGVRLLTGLRWFHISNARIYDENPGRDTVMVYAGLSFPF